MKILIRPNVIIFFSLLFLSNLTLANHYSSINYTIFPLFHHITPAIKVEVEIKGELSDNLIIDLPYRWASAEYISQIKNIKLYNTNCKFTINKDERHQLIINILKPIKVIKISYDIYQKAGNPSSIHETIIRNNLIHATGYGLLAVPNDLSDIDKLLVNIEWKNIHDDWYIISSHGYNNFLNFMGNVPILLHAVYIAGKVRVYQVNIENNPVFLSLYGTFELKDNMIINSLNKIIKSQRAFFNNCNFPYYLVSLIEEENPYSIGGSLLHNSFVAYLPKGMNYTDYYILFAHEYLHNWLVENTYNNDQEGLNYWWT